MLQKEKKSLSREHCLFKFFLSAMKKMWLNFDKHDKMKFLYTLQCQQRGNYSCYDKHSIVFLTLVWEGKLAVSTLSPVAVQHCCKVCSKTDNQQITPVKFNCFLVIVITIKTNGSQSVYIIIQIFKAYPVSFWINSLLKIQMYNVVNLFSETIYKII